MKYLFTILTILISTHLWGQEYLVDLRVKKIVYKGDSLVYDIPKTFESTTTQVTPVIEIGKIGNNIFGVQIELLKSKLGQDDRYIAGRVYYIRKGKTSGWEKLLTSIHQRVRVDELKNRIKEEERQKTIKNEKDERTRAMYMETDSDTMQDEFGVYYYNYFYDKK
jgi:hypothetical protein